MNRLPLLAAGMLALGGDMACAHFQAATYQLYEGPGRPTEEVARLGGPVATVDGVDVSRLGSSFALLPGCHVVVLKKKVGEGGVGGAWSADLGHIVYAFRMKAGHAYEIDIHTQPGNGGVGNANVGDVKIKAVERDLRGTSLGAVTPVRNQAEIEACHDSDGATQGEHG